MLDTNSTEAEELIAAGYAEPRGSLAHQLALLANELRYERNQAEQERDTALSRASTASLALANAFERAARDADVLAAELHGTDAFGLPATGPTPANERFVSAMAAMEPDEDEIAEAIELAEREERERYYQDSNETLGLSVGGAW